MPCCVKIPHVTWRCHGNSCLGHSVSRSVGHSSLSFWRLISISENLHWYDTSRDLFKLWCFFLSVKFLFVAYFCIVFSTILYVYIHVNCTHHKWPCCSGLTDYKSKTRVCSWFKMDAFCVYDYVFSNYLPVIYASDLKMFIMLVKTFQMCFTPSDPSQRWQKTFRISRNHVCWCFIWRSDAIAFIIWWGLCKT